MQVIIVDKIGMCSIPEDDRTSRVTCGDLSLVASVAWTNCNLHR